MFGIRKKTASRTCQNCHHYDEYRTKDRLNEDKTITKGKLVYMVCDKNREPFELSDVVPCDFWKKDEHDAYNRKSGAISFHLKKLKENKLKY